MAILSGTWFRKNECIYQARNGSKTVCLPGGAHLQWRESYIKLRLHINPFQAGPLAVHTDNNTYVMRQAQPPLLLYYYLFIYFMVFVARTVKPPTL